MPALNSFFVATGSNLADRAQNLIEAKNLLQQHFELIAESRIYESPAVDYLNQPDFYNQVLEFKLPLESPESVMSLLLDLESEMGRNRLIPKGPRLIDLDILFWGLSKIESPTLHIPHPRLFDRSFVVLPLSELPGFKILKENFIFKFQFDNHAIALS
jgi:2-amino-4-hydroxy-6-hydroxymethyldihydropteridine diphosphokinase